MLAQRLQHHRKMKGAEMSKGAPADHDLSQLRAELVELICAIHDARALEGLLVAARRLTGLGSVVALKTLDQGEKHVADLGPYLVSDRGQRQQ